MAIKINWKDLEKRIINWQEVEKVMLNEVQIRPEVTPPVDDYLWFEALSWYTRTIALGKEWNPTAVNFEYSYDTESWTDYTLWDSLDISNGTRVYFRNKSEIPTWFSTSIWDYYAFWTYYQDNTPCVKCGWDATYLLCKNGTDTIPNYWFTNLFSSLGAMVTPPSLTATTVWRYWYYSMFWWCSNLTTAPALPATTLGEYCYAYMFYNCSNLTTASALPATTLASCCYMGMFEGCSSLTVAPTLPAITVTYWWYAAMFRWCSSLTTAPSLPATTLNYRCYGWMFRWCTSLVTLPELPATILENGCYYEMFEDCTGIKLSTTQTWEYQTPYTIPSSWTGTTGSDSLLDMFIYTWWTFTGTPTINTTYYTSNTIIS